MRRQRTALTADSACASDIALRRTRSHRGCTAFWVVGIVVCECLVVPAQRLFFDGVHGWGAGKKTGRMLVFVVFEEHLFRKSTVCHPHEIDHFVGSFFSPLVPDHFVGSFFWSRRSVFACMGFCEGHKGTGLLSTSDVSAAQRERMSYCTAEAVGGILAFYVFGLACATFLAQIQACELDLGGIDS